MISKENLKRVKELQEEKEYIDGVATQIRKDAELEIKQWKKENSYEYLEEQLNAEKQKVESEALREYTFTEKKKLNGGIGIREVTNINYDEKDAFDWAKKHELCLKLDKKAFEKLAKNQDIDFVKEEKEIKVTWPKEIKLED
jgi:hypothetical protein